MWLVPLAVSLLFCAFSQVTAAPWASCLIALPIYQFIFSAQQVGRLYWKLQNNLSESFTEFIKLMAECLMTLIAAVGLVVAMSSRAIWLAEPWRQSLWNHLEIVVWPFAPRGLLVNYCQWQSALTCPVAAGWFSAGRLCSVCPWHEPPTLPHWV